MWKKDVVGVVVGVVEVASSDTAGAHTGLSIYEIY